MITSYRINAKLHNYKSVTHLLIDRMAFAETQLIESITADSARNDSATGGVAFALKAARKRHGVYGYLLTSTISCP